LLALHCTPNDLLEWKPSEKYVNAEAKPLYALVRGDNVSLKGLFAKCLFGRTGKSSRFYGTNDAKVCMIFDLNEKDLAEKPARHYHLIY
jgi:hypothetical protein